jgi:putative oxidoreductase
MNKVMNFTGRLLMAQIFLVSGISKLSGYAATQGYMEAMGVPGALLPLVIALEIGGAAALVAGFQTRFAALALAGFSLVSAFIFHANFADQVQMIMFMKNLAMAGGLLAIASAQTERTFSLDAYCLKYARN